MNIEESLKNTLSIFEMGDLLSLIEIRKNFENKLKEIKKYFKKNYNMSQKRGKELYEEAKKWQESNFLIGPSIEPILPYITETSVADCIWIIHDFPEYATKSSDVSPYTVFIDTFERGGETSKTAHRKAKEKRIKVLMVMNEDEVKGYFFNNHLFSQFRIRTPDDVI